MGLKLNLLEMSPELFKGRYIQKALRTRLIILLMLLPLNRCVSYDVMMTLWCLKAFCLEKSSVWKAFQCEFGWNKVIYARTTISHVYFIALTLAGSLMIWAHSLSASCSNSLLRTWQVLMCNPYIQWKQTLSYICKHFIKIINLIISLSSY